MATEWYVKTERGIRGPMGFQDVAFLIHDQQISEDGLVRRADDDDWQIASSVVGMTRAARQHRGIDERVLTDDAQLSFVRKTSASATLSQKPRQKREPDERQRIIAATHESLQRDRHPVGNSRRSFLQQALAFGPLVIILAAMAYAAFSVATYDRFADKNFEQQTQ